MNQTTVVASKSVSLVDTAKSKKERRPRSSRKGETPTMKKNGPSNSVVLSMASQNARPSAAKIGQFGLMDECKALIKQFSE